MKYLKNIKNVPSESGRKTLSILQTSHVLNKLEGTANTASSIPIDEELEEITQKKERKEKNFFSEMKSK